MSHRLLTLINALAELNDHDAHAAAEDGNDVSAEIEVDGVDFLFMHESARPDRFMVYGHLGQAAPESAPAFHARLLQTNLAIAPRGHGGYSLHSETGEVIYAFKAGFDEVDPCSLLDTLRTIAREAEAWRRELLLESAPTPSA